MGPLLRRQIHVMHDYRGNRSTLYGPAPDSDSEAEEGAEQVTRCVGGSKAAAAAAAGS